MTYKSELNKVLAGEIKPVYLLYGEETFRMRDFEKAVIEGSLSPADRENGLIVFDQEPDLRDLTNQIETAPFWSEKNVIVVRSTSLFRSSRKAKVEEQGEAGDQDEIEAEPVAAKPGEDVLLAALSNMPSYSRVIFSITAKKEKNAYKEIDKRRKSFKIVEKHGVALEVASLQANEAHEWVQERLQTMGKRLERSAAEHIWSSIGVMTSVPIGFLENELNKLDLYTGERTLITKQDVMTMMSAVPEVSIFTMLEAMSRKQVQEALFLLQQQLSSGVYPLIILTLLARQVRLLWQVKELSKNGNNSAALARHFKLPAFVVERLQRQSRGFSIEALQRAMLSLAEADRDLKSGKATNAVFEIILIDMCR
ncbi:MAG: yqeN [Firmicutes bacterium]|nr:yqeN [Bacillota bacterium]